ncbi:MAG: formylglycine-generating enzyme family protein [Acidobacteriota bacterium]
MEFRLIRAGSFEMGSPEGERGREDQEVLHPVRLTRAFYLGRSEVTQGQWRKVMGDNPSHFLDCGSECPVENVSWFEVREFLNRLGENSGEVYRLPTEAEWEYACRAGSRSPFGSGQELSTEEANYDGSPPLPGWPAGIDRERTTPAGSFPANAWGFPFRAGQRTMRSSLYP